MYKIHSAQFRLTQTKNENQIFRKHPMKPTKIWMFAFILQTHSPSFCHLVSSLSFRFARFEIAHHHPLQHANETQQGKQTAKWRNRERERKVAEGQWNKVNK